MGRKPIGPSLARLSAALLLAACGAEEGSGPVGPTASAVLITLDTTRADVLGCYGGQASTPHLDRLAGQGIVYDAAYTSVPITLPAHCSMLTGLYPVRHTVRDNGLRPLPPAADTLAEMARQAGIETAAFLGAVVLDRTFGLDQGFDHYDLPGSAVLQPGSEFAERSAAAVVDATIEWLRARDTRRELFLWVHLFDPHLPYAPPEEFLDAGAGADEPARYRGEVASMDHEIGRLLEALEQADVLPEATVMVVGDHGEAFGEHGERTHGLLCYGTTLRIPFLLRHPDGHRQGEHSDEVVSVVDVCPTLAEAMGLPLPQGIDGQSLLRRRVAADRGVYFESYTGHITYGWSPIVGWLDASRKYVHSSAPELFDLAADPEERSNRLDQHGDVARLFQGSIAALADAGSLPQAEDTIIDPALLDAIQGLGYASSGSAPTELPHPLDPVDSPSPASMLDVHYRTLEAIKMLDGGNAPLAAVLLQGILRQEPRNFLAQDRLAVALMRQGKPAEAVSVLEQLVRDGPPWPGARFNLGLCLFDTGRQSEGIEMVQRAVELDPRQPQFLTALVFLLQRSGRADEALPYQRRLEELTRPR